MSLVCNLKLKFGLGKSVNALELIVKYLCAIKESLISVLIRKIKIKRTINAYVETLHVLIRFLVFVIATFQRKEISEEWWTVRSSILTASI
jgi:hypothetical protein